MPIGFIDEGGVHNNCVVIAIFDGKNTGPREDRIELRGHDDQTHEFAVRLDNLGAGLERVHQPTVRFSKDFRDGKEGEIIHARVFPTHFTLYERVEELHTNPNAPLGKVERKHDVHTLANQTMAAEVMLISAIKKGVPLTALHRRLINMTGGEAKYLLC
ncbi:MAG: hypothetical protein HYS32_02830 [Candidatus Woesearchaeota archaeon]|nr:MAG: hypothetical protein HYS32_02830 [Candidatus Woesearchaeota archaeon]